MVNTAPFFRLPFTAL